jgi:hypothetical protein
MTLQSLSKRFAESATYRSQLVLARSAALAYDNRPSREALDPELKPLLDTLNAKGFVKIPFFVGQVDEVSEKVRSTFSQAESADRKVVGQNIRHPFHFTPMTEKVLREERLSKLVRAYIGHDATFDFAQIFRIPASTDNVTLSGLWHHDRVGKRLKLFVYLHDVRKGERITHYAVGSHKRQHVRWSHKASRYTDEWINARYEVEQFEGLKGEAYLFDTNGIHRATWEANSNYRDALYFEWSSYGKSRLMRRLGYHIGVCREPLPQGFDPAGTLFSRRDLASNDGQLVYGTTAPKFNFVN